MYVLLPTINFNVDFKLYHHFFIDYIESRENDLRINRLRHPTHTHIHQAIFFVVFQFDTFDSFKNICHFITLTAQHE